MTLTLWDVLVVSFAVVVIGVGADVALHYMGLWFDRLATERRRKEWKRGQNRNQ